MGNKITRKDVLTRGLLAFTELSVAWLAIMLILSILELAFNGFTHGLPPKPISVLAWAWLGDFESCISLQLVVAIIYMLIYLASEKAANIVFFSLIMFWLFGDLILISYFQTALVPLGADIFGYSSADIKQTVGSSGVLSVKNIAILLTILIGGFLLLRTISRKIALPIWVPLLLLLLSFGSLFITAPQPAFNNDYANNLCFNKVNYFTNAVYRYLYPVKAETDIYADSYIGDFGDNDSKRFVAFSYPDPDHYPFLHPDNTADVLTPFFNIQKNSPPNIIIILVEGLGRAFTNDGAYLGNFTPFIDSLSGKSLYWKNFLSSGGRTFAVLPALLGSLPFEKNGFLETGAQMLPQLSLLNLSEANGYHTSFYYGGDATFDNMSLYLKNNKVNEINDMRSFPSGYVKLPAVDGFTWGYNDHELFRHYLATRSESTTPQLSVILTVSTHSPFVINDEQQYLKVFEQRMTTLGFDEAKKEEYRHYREQYASILYTDHCLQQFFDRYSKRSDFNNTIFLITGDHRMPELPMSDKIDRYHVPLIIYSPMLKHPAQFASVSVHFDIAPSLLAFLKHNYRFSSPSLTSFIGSGLDTNRSFRNIHQYPLMQTKTDMIDFVCGNYHLNGQQLFKLNAEMGEIPDDDANERDKLRQLFDQFKSRNQLLIDGKGKLLPDSILKHYGLGSGLSR